MEPVAPPMATPPLFHWRVGAGLPLAATVNVTEPPVVTVWLTGWVVKDGAVLGGGAAWTVSVAPAEVAEPATFVATAV